MGWDGSIATCVYKYDLYDNVAELILSNGERGYKFRRAHSVHRRNNNNNIFNARSWKNQLLLLPCTSTYKRAVALACDKPCKLSLLPYQESCALEQKLSKVLKYLGIKCLTILRKQAERNCGLFNEPIRIGVSWPFSMLWSLIEILLSSRT